MARAALPTRSEVHPSELALLRNTRRPGDRVAYYEALGKGGVFQFVGPLSPYAEPLPRFRGRTFCGFVNLDTGAIEPATYAQAVAA